MRLIASNLTRAKIKSAGEVYAHGSAICRRLKDQDADAMQHRYCASARYTPSRLPAQCLCLLNPTLHCQRPKHQIAVRFAFFASFYFRLERRYLYGFLASMIHQFSTLTSECSTLVEINIQSLCKSTKHDLVNFSSTMSSRRTSLSSFSEASSSSSSFVTSSLIETPIFFARPARIFTRSALCLEG